MEQEKRRREGRHSKRRNENWWLLTVCVWVLVCFCLHRRPLPLATLVAFLARRTAVLYLVVWVAFWLNNCRWRWLQGSIGNTRAHNKKESIKMQKHMYVTVIKPPMYLFLPCRLSISLLAFAEQNSVSLALLLWQKHNWVLFTCDQKMHWCQHTHTHTQLM